MGRAACAFYRSVADSLSTHCAQQDYHNSLACHVMEARERLAYQWFASRCRMKEGQTAVT